MFLIGGVQLTRSWTTAACWLTASTFFGLSALSPTFAQEANAVHGFKTPSENIYCIVEVWGPSRNEKWLRCDIRQTSVAPPRRPRDCIGWGDWGNVFTVQVEGQSARVCYTDTALGSNVPVLPYTEVWQSDGFTCKSEENGLTCFNADRHGFTLSKGSQVLF
jgi:hypothetical protein